MLHYYLHCHLVTVVLWFDPSGECEALAEEIIQLKQGGEDLRAERETNLAYIAQLETQVADLLHVKASMEYALITCLLLRLSVFLSSLALLLHTCLTMVTPLQVRSIERAAGSAAWPLLPQ